MNEPGLATFEEEERLRILALATSGLGEVEVLEYALDQAVADLGALSGMVHWAGAPASSGEPRLVVSSGLPPAELQAWGEIRDVVVRALRDGRPVCASVVRSAAPRIRGTVTGEAVAETPAATRPDPTRPGPARTGPTSADPARTEPTSTDPALTDPALTDPARTDPTRPGLTPTTATPTTAAPPVATLTAVPLPGRDAPIGVLSVLSSTGPTGRQQAFLRSLVGWLAQRLTRSGIGADARRPWWREPTADSRLRQALKATRIGSWDWNIKTGELFWDEAALTVLGIDPATGPHNTDSWVALIHPEDHPRVMTATEEAIRTGGLYEVEYRARRPDGTTGWVQERGHLVLDEAGEPQRMIGTVWDTTESRAARESVSRALCYMSDAFLAVDRDWRVTFVNLDAERLLGSADPYGQVLWDLPAGELPELRAACRRAVAEHVPAGLDVRWPIDHRWYHVRLVPVPDGLTLYLADVTERRLHDAEREAAEHAAAERAAWIQELTRAFGEAVTARDVVRIIAERVLPPFGAAGMMLLTVGVDRLHVAGAFNYPSDHLDRLENQRPLDRSPLADALRSRTPVFLTSAVDHYERYPDVLGWMARTGIDTAGMDGWVFLPLHMPDKDGCCVISFDRPHRFTSEERTLLTALSGLIAQALARARLYDVEHTRAEELQRLLLPRDLPSPPSVVAAARYLPAGTMAVGGDWYDIIPLSAERVALVIGDVMGHGLTEAATMGRLRTAVHTLAELDMPPEELLAHLSDLVSDLSDDVYVTCLYAVYDPTTGKCVLVSAGHPPPVIVHPDGTAGVLDVTPDPPLGLAQPPLTSFELDLPEGCLFALYTDGLVESATRDMDTGVAELTGLLTGVIPDSTDYEDLERLCATVVGKLLPDRHLIADDAALLIARARRLGTGDVACWALPEDPIAAGEAREHVRDQLATWDLDDLVTTTELIASELVGNVIRHARGPVRLRLLRSRTLVCEVSDGSQTTPRIRRAAETDEGGRGLQLVAALSQRWGTRFTTDGKCIWAEQSLTDPETTL